jgi:DNA polymerase III epsilon subunit-like protein
LSDNPWKSRRLVAFDTETTGLDAFGGDRVIEFAAVELELAEDGMWLRSASTRGS